MVLMGESPQAKRRKLSAQDAEPPPVAASEFETSLPSHEHKFNGVSSTLEFRKRLEREVIALRQKRAAMTQLAKMAHERYLPICHVAC